MAKVTGPLLSLDASGSVADTMTFSKWKGRNYVRQRVTPSNPKTADQLAVRSILGTLAKACKAVLTSYKDTLFVGSQFFQDARDNAPSGQSWISWLQKVDYAGFDARVTTYTGLSGTIQGYYNTSALAIGLVAYTDVAGDSHTAGEQLYHLASFATIYLGYVMTGGINAPSSGTITDDFADYVSVSA